MKFKVDSLELINLSKICTKGVSSKIPNSQVLFKLEDDKLIIQGSSQTSFFKGSIPVRDVYEIDDLTEFSVDGEQLKTIITILPQANVNVEFSLSPSGRLFTLDSGNSKLKLPVYENIITYSQEEIHELSNVTASSFMKNISSLARFLESDAMSQDSPTSCLHIFIDDQIKYVGTNGLSLAEVTSDNEKLTDESDFVVLLKAPQISLLSNVFEEDEVLTLIHTENLFGYKDSKGTVALVSKADIAPLYYEMLKSRVSDEQSVTLENSSFKRAVDALGKLCLISNAIHFTINENSVEATNDNGDDLSVILEEKNADEVTLSFLKQSLLPVFNLLTDKFQMTWQKEDPGIVKFNLLNENNEVDDKVFIGVSLND